MSLLNLIHSRVPVVDFGHLVAKYLPEKGFPEFILPHDPPVGSTMPDFLDGHVVSTMTAKHESSLNISGYGG